MVVVASHCRARGLTRSEGPSKRSTRNTGGVSRTNEADDVGSVADGVLRLAADVGYSETAFVERASVAGAYEVRYFSPRAEVPLCGHATVATAIALATRDGVGTLQMSTRAGVVEVETRRAPAGITATLTSVPTHQRRATPDELHRALTALGWRSADLDDRYPPHVAYAGVDHLVLAVRERSTLARLDYDYAALDLVMAERGWTTLQLVWAESPTQFHARNPFPPGGVVEDPATGAAALAFGGSLRDLGLVDLPATVTIRQGEDMGRPSRLVAGERRIKVTGTAVPIIGLD